MVVTPALIVDDSLMISKLIKKSLLLNNLDGYHFEEQKIFTASDGLEAFEMMGKGHNIKLIITDINMPNLNGYELIEILEDTGKLGSVDVVFVTSPSSTKLFLSGTIKEHILGVIYKPFKVGEFNDKLNLLRKNKIDIGIERNEIKKKQVQQKKYLEKATIKYLNEYQIFIKKDILDIFIDENFTHDNILKSEFPEIVYSILSSYLFETANSHVINSKNILCILKSLEKKSTLSKNRFQLIEGFEDKITYVNSTDLQLKEILQELTIPLLDKISMAFAKTKKFPKLKSQLFSEHFNYISEELSIINCSFIDQTLQKLLLEHTEVNIFSKWLYNFLKTNELSTQVDAVLKSELLKNEVIKRLKIAYQRSLLLLQHYCGEIEFYLWKRAKESSEIVDYFKKNLPKSLLNSGRFLLYKEKISAQEHAGYLVYEKYNVVVMSDDLSTLGIFKEIVDAPFDKWNFFCFAKLSLLDAWMTNNIPNKIIIDYNLKSPIFENGIQFLKFIIKRYPIFIELVEIHQVSVIANIKDFSFLHKYKKNYNFSIIEEPLYLKNIYHNLLYN